MVVFVARRLIVSCFVLLAATAAMFTLVAHAGDPLADLRLSTAPNRADLIAHRSEILHLDQSVPQRYAAWLGHASGCLIPGRPCDLGRTVQGQDVATLLGQAIVSTLTLVTGALVLAILLGVGAGVISALRQRTGLDYAVTFSASLFFSLPVFWVAVLLKQFLAIEANDWYADPTVGPLAAAVLSALSGLFWGAVLGGDRARRWLIRFGAASVTFGLLEYLSVTGWFARPALGPGIIAACAFGIAVGVTALVAGPNRRGVLTSALGAATAGSLAQFLVTGSLQQPTWASFPTLLLLGLSAVGVAVLLGWLLGGPDRPAAIRAAVLTALLTGLVMVIDVMLRALPGYSRLVRGRIIATAGSQTPNLDGTFWQTQLDQLTHLVLPTLAIMLISYATYSRYSRASLLDALGQDYVRTARAKGLPERTVILRHALRNALIPVTTLAAVDFGVLIGGAVITEAVFARPGMGALFIQGLLPPLDPNPIMGFFGVVAVSVVVFNLLADIAYAYLDPRIRLG
jgi:peptide/nickel transport system permease protein